MMRIWRRGTRYATGLFKVGAILVIVPFVNVVGWILILLGARAGRRKIESRRLEPDFE